jgi:hypothetical protein
MLTRSQAKQLVQRQLASEVSGTDYEIAVIDSATLERHFGWVFFYQSKKYLLTGNYSDQLAGNAPLIVNRHTGEVITTGTAEPIEEYIASYEASLASGAA